MAKKRKKPVAKRKPKAAVVSPEAKLLANVGRGRAVPRADVVATVGKHKKIAWWDMIELDPVQSAPADLAPGYFRTCNLNEVPTAVWQVHLADWAREGGHGLNLAPDPSIMGIFRYDGDDEYAKFGLLVGYAAKY